MILATSREAQQQAKRLLHYSLIRGHFDTTKARRAVNTLIKMHPRGLMTILITFKKILKQRISNETANVSLSYKPNKREQKKIINSITQRFGNLICHFSVDPTLIGGMRVQVGDVIYESSISEKLILVEEAVYANN